MEEFLKRLREKLQLAEDASEDVIVESIAKAVKKPEEAPLVSAGVTLEELAEAFGTGPGTKEDLLEKAKATRPPEVTRQKQFERQFPEEAKRLAETSKRLGESEVIRKLDEWHRGTEFGGIPTALDDYVKEIRGGLPPSLQVKFDEMVKKLLDTGLVVMAEIGASHVSRFSGDANEFLLIAKQKQKDNPKLSFEDAIRETTKTHPELAESYRTGVSKAAEEGVG